MCCAPLGFAGRAEIVDLLKNARHVAFPLQATIDNEVKNPTASEVKA
jgi:hypothetical protein